VTGPRSRKPASPAPAAIEARLRELEALTREYALAGRALHGLTTAVLGLLLVAAPVLAWLGYTRTAALLLLSTPPLATALSALMRRWYQRHGLVSDGAPAGAAGHGQARHRDWANLAGWALVLLWLAAAALGPAEALGTGLGLREAVQRSLPLASGLLTTGLLLRFRTRRSDQTWFMIPSAGLFLQMRLLELEDYVGTYPAGMGAARPEPNLEAWFLSLFGGAILLLLGLFLHLRDLKLQARLVNSGSPPAEAPPPA